MSELDLQVRGFTVPAAELSYHFSRSGGPGGQHVNTTASQVELRWDIAASPCLTDAIKALLREKLVSYVDSKGVLHLVSSEARSQLQNRQAVTTRLKALLYEALRPPKKRIATRPTFSSQQNRLDTKRRQKDKKQSRRWKSDL